MPFNTLKVWYWLILLPPCAMSYTHHFQNETHNLLWHLNVTHLRLVSETSRVFATKQYLWNDGSITANIITKECGLRKLTMSMFEVRACSRIDVRQKWIAGKLFGGRLQTKVQCIIWFMIVHIIVSKSCTYNASMHMHQYFNKTISRSSAMNIVNIT